MKLSSISLALAAVVSVSGHAIFQKISINGADQGQLRGVRAPNSNYPIQNVNDPELACNKNIQHKDNNVHTIAPGARIGAWWGHVIGGPQGPNDLDHPIAASHKGPITYWLAKVNNAASSGTTGLSWFKVAEDGLTGDTWAVDRMISGNGWHYFDFPTCIAPGDYLLRVELLALHSARIVGEAQFYVGCAQIRVSGSGTTTGAGSTVSFPGAYTSNDPGIQISIYDNRGQPTNGGRPYAIPGPRPITCSGVQPPAPPTTTTSAGSGPAPTTAPPPTGGAPLYGQCGGTGWTGPTTCSQGTCTASNQWYSQCLP